MLPHRHGASPPCGACTWPRSPAAPWAPRCSRPSLMMPAPMPVATLTKTMWSSRAPRSATSPRTRSPSAITFTSLSTSTGQPRPAPTHAGDVEAVPAGHDRRVGGASRGVLDRAGQADAHPEQVLRTPTRLAQQRLAAADEPLQHGVGTVGDLDVLGVLGQHLAVERGDGEPGVGGADVGTDDDPGSGGRTGTGWAGGRRWRRTRRRGRPARSRPARRAAARPWTGPARWPR